MTPDTNATNAGAGAAVADKGWLERLLSPIADVRRGEAASALLITLTMFLVLARLLPAENGPRDFHPQ